MLTILLCIIIIFITMAAVVDVVFVVRHLNCGLSIKYA